MDHPGYHEANQASSRLSTAIQQAAVLPSPAGRGWVRAADLAVRPAILVNADNYITDLNRNVIPARWAPAMDRAGESGGEPKNCEQATTRLLRDTP